MIQISAQNAVLIEGTIYSSEAQPIAFAHIKHKETTFTVADAEGNFSLKVNGNLNDSLEITAIGFITLKVPIKHFATNRRTKVIMQPETFVIDGVTINNNKAKNHWLLVLEKLQKQLPSSAYTYPALYRQVHQENGTYVRLIEAGMTVYDVAATYRSDMLQERFNLEQVRRSNVLERNGDAHGDHLVDMFLENNLRYPTSTIMDAKVVGEYEIRYDDSQCEICGDSLEQLAYKYENVHKPKLLEGKIWIYKGSLKLYGLQETATRNPQFIERGMSLGGSDHHWMFQTSVKNLRFSYYDGMIYLNNLQFEYLHHIQERTIGVVRYEVTESFSMFCNAPTLHPGGFVPDNRYARKGNLYSRKYEYEESFWQHFSLAIDNPLPTEVVQTFSSKLPLMEQFKRNGE
jgi:hypothetical protein